MMKTTQIRKNNLPLKCFLLMCAFMGMSHHSWAQHVVSRLRTEAMKNPVGIDVKQPRFSWTLQATDDARNISQKAYEIKVFSDAGLQNMVWTSGQTESSMQANVPYQGDALASSTRYYWTVTVWDNHDNEASTTEKAYFETGLMDEGWDGAQWISATNIPLQQNADNSHYAVETDFEIDNLAAGVIFAAKDKQNYFMWQVNLEAGYPRFRPHAWRNGGAACLAELDLRGKVDVELHKTYHLRIEVDRNIAKTYIDDVLIDTRENPYGENYEYGLIGIRQDRALNNYNDLERAWFDNFVVTNLTSQATLLSVDFSSSNPFTNGAIDNGRLKVEANYAWYETTQHMAYNLDADFRIKQDCAAFIFSATDANNTHMWSINIKEKNTPFLRRHVRKNGAFTFSDKDLSSFFTKAQLTEQLHHIKICVKGNLITTYIDDKEVDSYTDNSGTLCQGLIGFRAYHDKTMNEQAYFDNIRLTSFASDTDEAGTILIHEDFEDAGHDFDGGTVASLDNNKLLLMQSSYEEDCIFHNPDREGMPMLRTAFTTTKEIQKATLYASAFGGMNLYINGQRVGHLQADGTTLYDELAPGWTDYRKEVQYVSYDVTHLLSQGDNAMGAQLSHGWWIGGITHGIYGNATPATIVKLKINYTDGTVENIVSSPSWHSSCQGALIMGDIYNGETYDARRESAWSTAAFDDSNWNKTAAYTGFNGALVAHQVQPVNIRTHLTRSPINIKVYDGVTASGSTYGKIHVTREMNGDQSLSLKAGETAIFDMGQNMVGWVRFTVQGQRGTNLKFRFAEMLNDTGDESRANDGPGGSLYTYNLRTAGATLNYTMRGDEKGESFNPSSSFFGFRYCEVTATSDVVISSLKGQVVGSDIEETGTINTSHPDINQLFSNIQWGQRGNFLSIPTDCPQRDERLGWTADTQIFSRTASYNANTQAFYNKWMADMRNGQRADGAYPDMAPFCNFWGYGNAAWGDAGVIVPWTTYLMFDDKGILENNYTSMTRYMIWLSTLKEGSYQYNGAGTGMGDWLAYEATDARYVSVCYYAYVAQLMSKIAQALSTSALDSYALDAEKYATLYENIKKEFQSRYLDSNGLPTVSTQTSYLLALQYGLLPDAAIEKAKANLRNKIAANNYKLSTGFVGTGILNQTLSNNGLDDIAYNLLLQRENPSWLYSIDQGATTVWERWDSYTKEGGFNKHPWIMNSFNHYAYGVIAEWMYGQMVGIEPDEQAPGFKHFILHPSPDFRTSRPAGQQAITWAEGSYQSSYGLIKSRWDVTEDKQRIVYQATVPANSSATLYLPLVNDDDEVYEGGKKLEDVEGVTFKGVENGKAVIELTSGSYIFTTTENMNTNISNTASHEKLVVYPNPVREQLNIKHTDPIVSLCATNTNGKMVFTAADADHINTSSWTPGIYIIHAKTMEHNLVTKVMKE